MPSVISTNLAKPKPPKPSPTGTNAGLAPDDASLFRAVVGEVKSLPDPGRIALPPVPNSAVPRRRLREHSAAPDDLSDHLPHQDLTDDETGFLRPGVTPQALRRLRRGHWRIQDELDLHGLTHDTARARLVEFLVYCLEHNAKCVRIIHGKGFGSKNHAPVLKQLVKSWLMQRAEVLAFVAARPEDGGAGALVVLLKRGPQNPIDSNTI